MTVCYFGHYHPEHPRNVVFVQALRIAGFTVLEINHRGRGFSKYVRLARALLENRKQIDLIIVGFPGQQSLVLAKLLFRGPVIFNPLVAQYDAVIGDREDYSKTSLYAAYLWFMDFLASHLADKIILDCNAYIDYFVEHFKVRREKFSRIFLGAIEDVYKPLVIPVVPYEIHYHSTFLPTHGVDVIIRAAKILEPEGISFIISGKGPYFEAAKKLVADLGVKNVTIKGWLKSTNELNEFINSSWVSLGLFGLRPRTERIIGSKVFEAMATGKPIITSRTSATEELLEDRESVLFVRPNNPAELAEKILILKNDEALRQRLARGSRQVYNQKASLKVISQELKKLIDEVSRKA